jgi:uncharacterized protein (UPF0264 family)
MEWRQLHVDLAGDVIGFHGVGCKKGKAKRGTILCDM